MSMQEGDRIRAEIIDISDRGAGIARAQGRVFFVDAPGLVPGDTVELRISKLRKKRAEAELIAVAKPSRDRTEALCPHAASGACGGCPLAGMKYEAQLRLKERWVRDRLERLGGLADPPVRPIVPAEAPLRYRNKASLAVAAPPETAVRLGFRRRGSHAVLDCPDCLLQRTATMAAAAALREQLTTGRLSAYDPAGGQGLLRGATLRLCDGTGEMMLVLTVTHEELPDAEGLVYAVADAIEACGESYHLQSVVLELQPEGHSRRPEQRYRCIAGSRTITDELFIGGQRLRFELSAAAFYQVNTLQMCRLYEQVADYAALQGGETVFDLYCGVGTIGLSLAARAGMLVGIEVEPQAVLDANRNAVINGIVNARYYAGRAEQRLPELLDPESAYYADYLDSAAPRVAILDPPRAGCAESLLETLAACDVRRIVYVSCDPGTLARDVRRLTERGYRCREATPVDMFPMTGHVETVVLLSRA